VTYYHVSHGDRSVACYVSSLCRGYGLAATCDMVVSVSVILTQFSNMNSEDRIVLNAKDSRQISYLETTRMVMWICS